MNNWGLKFSLSFPKKIINVWFAKFLHSSQFFFLPNGFFPPFNSGLLAWFFFFFFVLVKCFDGVIWGFDQLCTLGQFYCPIRQIVFLCFKFNFVCRKRIFGLAAKRRKNKSEKKKNVIYFFFLAAWRPVKSKDAGRIITRLPFTLFILCDLFLPHLLKS